MGRAAGSEILRIPNPKYGMQLQFIPPLFHPTHLQDALEVVGFLPSLTTEDFLPSSSRAMLM